MLLKPDALELLLVVKKCASNCCLCYRSALCEYLTFLLLFQLGIDATRTPFRRAVAAGNEEESLSGTEDAERLKSPGETHGTRRISSAVRLVRARVAIKRSDPDINTCGNLLSALFLFFAGVQFQE